MDDRPPGILNHFGPMLLLQLFTTVKVVLCQIDIFFHQLTHDTTQLIVIFTKIYSKSPEFQNLQNFCYEFQNNYLTF